MKRAFSSLTMMPPSKDFHSPGSKSRPPGASTGQGPLSGGCNLTLINDDFFNNQDGLLATPAVAGTGPIAIQDCEFAYNGAGHGYSHNIYVGKVAISRSTTAIPNDAKVGHDIKSRALVNVI